MNLREQAAAVKADMQNIVNRSKAAGRDLTPAEADEIESLAERHQQLTAQAERAEKAGNLVAELAAAPTGDSFRTKANGGASRWAKAVIERMDSAAAGIGVKALLNGEISTPPAVEVVDLPAVPARLLDLVARDRLDANNYSYLRQTVRTNNADVVPDGATKPTSVFTFEEVEDRARVVAHLSEPFPLRYLSDHASMVQVLDGEMRQGVREKLEQQLVSGTGTGEQFTGILTTTGTTAVPFTTDVLTTIRHARTVLQNKGENPTAWVLNPADVETFELMREDGATGGFLLNGTSLDTIFGPGVFRVPSLAVPQGTAILADWSKVRLRVREDVSSLAATQAGDLFDKNQVKLRAEGRWGIEMLRPQAIAIVDLAA